MRKKRDIEMSKKPYRTANKRTPAEVTIIGLTGSFGSGCTTAAKYLKSMGFRYFSLSDEIKRIAKRRFASANRQTYQGLGDSLREKKGPAYLASLIYSQIIRGKGSKKYVIESFRNHHEVLFFKNRIVKFYLINIDAPKQIRWERTKSKYLNEAEFNRDDERDKGDHQPEHGQHVSKCVDLADIVINNEGSINDLKKKLKRYLRLFENPGMYSPQDTEMCMSQAYLWSLESRCLKRKVGAVIVRHGHVIASGYNAPPRRIAAKNGRQIEVPPCKVNCYRDLMTKCKGCGYPLSLTLDTCPHCQMALGDEDKRVLGKHLDLCRSLHAEERAILQTAKFGGQSLQDSAIYTTTFPCLLCAKKIIETGIDKVVYIDPYPYADAYSMLKFAGVTLEKFEGVKSRMLDVLYVSRESA